MGEPKIGRRDVVEPIEPEAPLPATAAEAEMSAEVLYGYAMTHYAEPTPGSPSPPLCVQEHLKRLDHKWRWLSLPGVKRHGMRGFVTYSPAGEITKKIRAGDCPPGVYIDAENKLCWLDDAWLASQPRKLFDYRAAMVRKRIQEQTELSKNADQLKELARRAGGKLSQFDIQEEGPGAR